MPAQTAKITLSGTEYTVKAFTVEQLMRVTDLMQPNADGTPQRPDKIAFNILLIGLERTDPPVANPREVEATTNEVMIAVPVLLKLAGLQTEANPPVAAVEDKVAA